MNDAVTAEMVADEFCTLLCVRADGVAPVVDMAPWTELGGIRRYAERLLREHRSCEAVEVWRGGILVTRVDRT
jgi:hypothetical protein